MKFKYTIMAAVLAAMMALSACGQNTPASSGNGSTPASSGGGTTTTTASSEVDADGLPASRITPDSTVPSWEADKDNQKPVLEWYIGFDWYGNAEWGQDMLTQYITEETGISFNFKSGGIEMFQTSLASNQLSDLNTMGTYESVMKDVAKFALPMNKMAEKYDPYFNEAVADPNILQWNTLADGNYYFYPSFFVTQTQVDEGLARANRAFLIRKDIYDSLSNKDFTTPQGFIAAVTEIAEKYPTSEDGMPLMPFALSFGTPQDGWFGDMDAVLRDLLAIPSHKDHKYYDWKLDPDYLIWVGVLNQLYNDGILKESLFTKEFKIDDNMRYGAVGSMMTDSVSSLGGPFTDNLARNPEQTYIAVDGPRNSNGDPHTLHNGSMSGWTATFVSKTCKDPQTAMQFITYLASDVGMMRNYFGIEGVTYDIVDGKPQLKEEYQKMRDEDDSMFVREVGVGNLFWLGQDSFENQLGMMDADNKNQIFQWGANYLVAPDFAMDSYENQMSDEARADFNKINVKFIELYTAAIRDANGDVQKYADEYKQYRDANGWERIQSELDAIIDSNLKKMGQ